MKLFDKIRDYVGLGLPKPVEIKVAPQPAPEAVRPPVPPRKAETDAKVTTLTPPSKRAKKAKA